LHHPDFNPLMQDRLFMSFNFEANDFFTSFTPSTPPDGCTQCGICLSSCPTYTWSEDPEQSPMGRIRLIRALESSDSEELAPEELGKLESCLGCNTCELVCPSKVNFGKMLDESLARMRDRQSLPRITRLMLWLASRTAFLKPIFRVSYFAQVLGLRSLVSMLGLLKLVGLERANALLGRVAYPRKLTNRIHHSPTHQRVALFTGCFSSVMEQGIQQAAIDVFNMLGLEVTVPSGQGCCGALHRHNGELETAGVLARQNIRAFSADKAGIIVTTSSGCGEGLKDYGEWLDGEELATPVMDVSHYLNYVLNYDLTNAMSEQKIVFDPLPLKVALHTPCSLRQDAGQEEAVMELLQKIPGLEIVPLSGEPRCCGAGGSQMLSQPDMADALREEIVDEIRTMGADVLISSNLGCAMHLREGMAQAGIDIPLQHPVQLVAQAICHTGNGRENSAG
jgi:glycolate oxidase iron-sulfur subunit